MDAAAPIPAEGEGRVPAAPVSSEATLLPPAEKRSLRYTPTSVALIILAVLAVVAALYLARAFIVPLLIGILASYTLRPLVDWLRRFRIPQAIGAALVLVILVSGVSWIGYSLSDEVTVVIEKLPEAARKLRAKLISNRSTVPTALQNVQEAATELQRAATDVSQKPGTRPTPAPPPSASVRLRTSKVRYAMRKVV